MFLNSKDVNFRWEPYIGRTSGMRTRGSGETGPTGPTGPCGATGPRGYFLNCSLGQCNKEKMMCEDGFGCHLRRKCVINGEMCKKESCHVCMRYYVPVKTPMPETIKGTITVNNFHDYQTALVFLSTFVEDIHTEIIIPSIPIKKVKKMKPEHQQDMDRLNEEYEMLCKKVEEYTGRSIEEYDDDGNLYIPKKTPPEVWFFYDEVKDFNVKFVFYVNSKESKLYKYLLGNNSKRVNYLEESWPSFLPKEKLEFSHPSYTENSTSSSSKSEDNVSASYQFTFIF